MHGNVPLIALPIPAPDDVDVITRWSWEAYQPPTMSLRRRLETWMGSDMIFDPIWKGKFVPKKKWIKKALKTMIVDEEDDLKKWFSSQRLRYPA